jgi:hypothetical protein
MHIGLSYADKQQDLGVKVYEDLGAQVVAATEAFNDEIKTFNQLNKNSVSDIDFPKQLKSAIDAKLKALVTSYDLALQQAHATNLQIAD